MNSRQKSKADMYRLLMAYLELVPISILLLMPNFTAWFNEWKKIVNALFIQIDNQNRNRLGYALSKAGIRIRLINELSALCEILMSYATYTENQVLYNLANFTPTHLTKLNGELLISTANNISEAVLNIVADLADYGVTVSSMDDFKALKDSFIVAQPQPRDEIYNKKESTNLIKAAFKNADAHLVKMDGATRLVRQSQPVFKTEYNNRRKIVKPPSKKVAGRGKVTDANGNKMPYVRMKCDSLNINRLVSNKGQFTLKEATEGFHDIEFSFPGKQTITQSVMFYPHLRAQIDVTMLAHQA